MLGLMGSCASTGRNTATVDKSQIVVGFYNVENLFDTFNDPNILDDDFTPEGKLAWSTERYKKKLGSLTRVIQMIAPSEGPAVLGLCEIENKSVLVDLCDSLDERGRKYSIVHKDSPDERGIDVAFLYDDNLYTVIGTEWIPVILDDPDDPNTRDILHVWGTIGKEEVHFYVNHWPSRGGGQVESEPHRLNAAEKLRNSIDKELAKNAAIHVICMGDFNDYPSDKSLSSVLNAGVNIQSDKTLYNLMAAMDQAGLGSYNYRGDWGTLDQFIVSTSLLKGGAVSTSIDSAFIVKEDWMLFIKDDKSQVPNKTYAGDKYTGGFSDHLPIGLKLTMAEFKK
jgi:predicted extracellular nuclease